jgi:hypothetical protein
MLTRSNRNSDAPVQIQPEKVATTANLGALADEVRPLDLTTQSADFSTSTSFLLSVITQKIKASNKQTIPPTNQIYCPVQIQPEKVATTANLGALADEVRPLDLTTRTVASG